MKLLLRLIIVFAICLLAVPALTAPVQASVTINLSKDEGYVGDEIKVSGRAFHAGETVYIYYDEELQTDASAKGGSCSCCATTFAAYFTIPESCQGYHYIDAEDDSGRTATARFTVKPKVSLDESSGHVGDVIKVEGSGFPTKGTGITLRYYLDTDSHSGLDSNPYIDFPVAEVDSSGSWEQTFPVPASIKGTHSIDAYYNDDEGTLSEVNNDEARFKVQASIALNPDSGCVGDTITITGAGFAKSESDIKLRYDGSGELAGENVDEYGSWELSFTIPPCTKGSHVIEAFHGSSGTAIASAILTVGPAISLSPATGHVGQSFSVTGSAFDPNITVNISYQDRTVNATTDASGNLPAVTLIAKGKHGEQRIDATYGGNSAHSAIFYMEETPPNKPNLISPIDTKRIGFFASFTGKIRPGFQWAKVTDVSGIASYNLQIANSPDFTTPVASVSIASENPGLTDDTVAYALPKEHALSYGSYYWRVQAIDAAANEGEWSEIQFLHAGWLPRWAMSAIAASLLLLIIIISLALRRRRAYFD